MGTLKKALFDQGVTEKAKADNTDRYIATNAVLSESFRLTKSCLCTVAECFGFYGILFYELTEPGRRTIWILSAATVLIHLLLTTNSLASLYSRRHSINAPKSLHR